MALHLIVFLPLLAAIVAGLGGRWIGPFASKLVTTGALFVGVALSWPIFISYLSGDASAQVIPVLNWIRFHAATAGARCLAAVLWASAQSSCTAASPASGAPWPLASTRGSSAASIVSEESVAAWSQFV